MTMDTSIGGIVAGPDVISRGFVYVKESENLMDDVKKYIREEVEILESKGVRDWATIKSTLKDHIRDYIFQKTKRNPMILPIIMSWFAIIRISILEKSTCPKQLKALMRKR